MTDTPEYFPSRLDRAEQIILGLAERQANAQLEMSELRQEMRQLTTRVDTLTDNVDRVLARSAILDDVLLELRDSHEQHQRNFEEHQRTTNAALQSLESILLQLIRSNS
jgi:predicted  nucleic acid-binding Zn-ribbon protein